MTPRPDDRLERALSGVVAGVDEVGRGPLAGPVVAAAVILDWRDFPLLMELGLDDSKRLTARQRCDLYAMLRRRARIGLGAASRTEIDRVNILGASLLAMRRAVAALGILPDIALIDGNRAPGLPCPVRTVIGGDAQSLSIAAASVAAKVVRDGVMAALAQRHPGYGWEHNMGYPTRVHRDAIRRLGLTPHHRRSFPSLASVVQRELDLEPESIRIAV